MRFTHSILLVFLLSGTAAAGADPPGVQQLRLRPSAVVYADQVTLGDVLVLADCDAELRARIEHEPVQPRTPTGAALAVPHAEVVQRLHGLGVNMARVLVVGALECAVEFSASPAAVTGAAATPGGVLLRERPAEFAGRTLADVLRAHVEDELAELAGRAELEFDRGGDDYIGLTTPPWEFNITSSARGPRLGLREFRVVIRRDGRTQRTVQVFARVRLVRDVLVARRPLSVGSFVGREDVDFETRIFHEDADFGFTELEPVVGQQVRTFTAPGALIATATIKPVDLVRRSRPVTVVGDSGSVQVRLSGVALDSGSYGDTVRVRVGQSRHNRQLVRGVVTGLGQVRLAEESL